MSFLQLQNVCLQLNTAKTVLKQLNYKINQGDFIILLGKNGSGKSTLLKLLCGELHASLGKILFLNKDIADYSANHLTEQIAVLNQDCSASLFNSLTLYENFLLMKPKNFGHRSLSRQREFLKDYLHFYHPNLSDKLDDQLMYFSGGEKQAFALALRLLKPPKLLLLDEHTSALDPKTSSQIMQLTATAVQTHRMTCVLTTHDLDIALGFGNRVLILREGMIDKQFDGPVKNTLTTQQLLSHFH